MAIDINTYVATASDYARGYLFYADIWCSTVSYFKNTTSSYLVKSTSLPKQTIGEATTDWQGMSYKFATTQSFEDFSIVFKCDAKHELRSAFLKWSENIHNPITNVHGMPITYMGKVGLSQLDTMGNSILDYDLIGAWPKDISDVVLDYSTKEMSEFTVTFSYIYHTSKSSTKSALLGAVASAGASFLSGM